MCGYVLAARCTRVLPVISVSLQTEGAGKTGCALHPRSRVQCARKVRTRAYRSSGEHPAFPAQGSFWEQNVELNQRGATVVSTFVSRSDVDFAAERNMGTYGCL